MYSRKNSRGGELPGARSVTTTVFSTGDPPNQFQISELFVQVFYILIMVYLYIDTGWPTKNGTFDIDLGWKLLNETYDTLVGVYNNTMKSTFIFKFWEN